MNDDPVFQALRELPRETASPGLRERVLHGVAATADGEPQGWSRGGLAIAASLVLLTVLGAGAFERIRQRQELRGEVKALREEHDQLCQELEALRHSTRNEPTQVLVGGDDRYDYVLSVPTETAGVRPAARPLKTRIKS